MKTNIIYKDYQITFKYNELEKLDKLIIYLKFYEWDKKEIDVENILTITKINIEDYFTPWPYEKFKGLANQLIFDLNEILNILESSFNFKNISYYTLGYSLGGLFACFSSFKMEKLSGFISCSGSLWYPKFKEFVFDNKPLNTKKCYFSIGDKETKGRGGLFKDNINITSTISNYFSLFCETKFELNEGNHFTNVEERILKGIKFILS